MYMVCEMWCKSVQFIGFQYTIVLLTVLIKQHFAPHQEPNIEVEFGYMTTLNPTSRVRGKLPNFLSTVVFSNVFDGSFLLKDGTNKQG